MNISLIKQESIGEMAYPKSLEREVSPLLISQYVAYVQSATTKKTGHTKTRGEVSGGGKKPWKQKGTGRARHGSSRSPIWTGGGVVFGPRREQEKTVRMNKKMRRLALAALLTIAAKDNRLAVAEFDESNAPKQIRTQLQHYLAQKDAVLVIESMTSPLQKASNLDQTKSISINRFGARQLYSNKMIVFDKESFANLVNRLQ